jgi:hypothetical protein
MNRITIVIWCFISFAVSGFFIYHGIVLFSLEGLSTAQLFYATSGTIYGAYSAGILALALLEAKTIHEKLARHGVIGMLAAQIVFGFINNDPNINIMSIFLSLAVILLMLSTNWLSVKYVVNRKQYT